MKIMPQSDQSDSLIIFIFHLISTKVTTSKRFPPIFFGSLTFSLEYETNDAVQSELN